MKRERKRIEEEKIKMKGYPFDSILVCPSGCTRLSHSYSIFAVQLHFLKPCYYKICRKAAFSMIMMMKGFVEAALPSKCSCVSGLLSLTFCSLETSLETLSETFWVESLFTAVEAEALLFLCETCLSLFLHFIFMSCCDLL